MANTNVSAMEGLFKEVYAGKEERLVPSGETTCADMFKYVPSSQREGEVFSQPVILQRSHGVTFNTDGSAYTLNEALSTISKPAKINGITMLFRETVSYPAIEKALQNKSGGAAVRAFVNATSYAVENAMESAAFYREVELLYGGGAGSEAAAVGIGTVNSRTDDSGTTQTFELTAASWAPALWAGMLGAKVDIHDAAAVGTKNVSGATVTAFEVDLKQVTLTGVEAELDTVAAGDLFYFFGTQGLEMSGLDRSITNTGTLHTISAATYNLWKGNTFAAGSAAFNFGKLLAAVRKGVNNGLNEEACALISPATWDNMLNDLSALRRYSDKAGGKLEQGSKELAFYSMNGTVYVKPHLYCKEGEAFVGPHKKCIRVGSHDIKFAPDVNGNYMISRDNIAGIDIRVHCNQNLLVQTPAKWTKVTGIVNTNPS